MKMNLEVFLQLQAQVPEAQHFRAVRNIADYDEPTADLLTQEVHFIQSLPKPVKLRQIDHLKYVYLAARLAFCGVVSRKDLMEFHKVKHLAELCPIPIPRLPGHNEYLVGDIKEWQEKWQ